MEYALWTASLKSRREIVPANLPGLAGGHISVYNFDEDTAKSIGIKDTDTIKKTALWSSPEVIIDIDRNVDEMKEKVKGQLRALNLSYDLYFTGGSGYHVYVPRQNTPHNHLPYSDYKWLTDQGFDVDAQIYHAFHLIRNKNAIHEKTLQPKKLIESFKGTSKLTVPLTTPPVRADDPVPLIGDSIFTDSVLHSALLGFVDGYRYQGMMNLATRLSRFSLTPEQAWFLLDHASRACHPKFDQLDAIWRYYNGIKKGN